MLINIQFLRFAAAMLVVLYHTSSHVRSTGVDQGWFFAVSEATGFAGVDIFFVISGFIMAYTTGDDTGMGSGWNFFRRRCARIYSGYWPFFLLALVLYSITDPSLVEKSSLLRSAILWPANHLLIAVSWTLIFEMFFYALFTLLIIFFWQWRVRILWLLFLFVLGWVIYAQFFRHAYDPGQLEYISLAEYYTLSPYLLEFLGGALLAARVPFGRLRAPGGLLLLGSALFLLAGWINNHYFGGTIEQGYTVFYRVILFGLPAFMIISGMVGLERAGTKFPVKFSLLAGGASYAIYLCHTLLLRGTQFLGLNEYASQLDAWQVQWIFLVYSGLMLGYGILHFRLIEQPMHRGFKKALRV